MCVSSCKVFKLLLLDSPMSMLVRRLSGILRQHCSDSSLNLASLCVVAEALQEPLQSLAIPNHFLLFLILRTNPIQKYDVMIVCSIKRLASTEMY